MSLQQKVLRLKLDALIALRHALWWEKQIQIHGEDKATAFYTSLGLNHLETKPAPPVINVVVQPTNTDRFRDVVERITTRHGKKSIEWEGLTLSREPTEAERRCVKGIAGAQETSKEKITALLTELRTQLISDGLKGIEKLDAATYHTLILDTPAGFRPRLRDRLIKVYRQGRSLVAGELGKKAAEEDEFDDLDMLTDLTNARVVNDVQARIIAAAARFRLLGLEEVALFDAVRSEIRAGSLSYIDRAATGLANKVINIGRSDEAEGSGYGHAEYSAILDQNVCPACSSADGETSTSEDDLTPAPNPECEGGDWCRCFHIFVFDTVA